MNENRAILVGVLLVAALFPTACSDDNSATPTAPAVTSTTAVVDPTTTPPPPSTTPAAVTIDDADFSWSLNGDGSARSGGIDVELVGAFAASDEAVSFDGYTGYAVTSGPSPVDTTESFTLTAWANYARASSITTILGLLGDDSYAAALSVDDAGHWAFPTKTEDVTGLEHATVVQGGAASAGDSWTHLAGVYDADSERMSFYVDGELVGEGSAGPVFDAHGPLTIGRSQFDGGPGNFWPGAIGDVAVFQRALTARDVAGLYETTRPSSPPPPIAAPDPSTYGNGILNGTWDYVYDDEDAQVILDDFAGFVDDADEVIVRIGFDDHEYWIGFLFDGYMPMDGRVPEGAGGTFTIEDDILINHEREGDSIFQFALADDSLTLTLLEVCDMSTPPQCGENTDELHSLVTEHEFTKSSDDPRHYDR